MSQIASDAKISSAMTALGMTAPLPNLDDSQVLKAVLVALGNVTTGGGGGGTGNVVGPASSTNGDIAVFSGTTGKLLADGAALTAKLNGIEAGADVTDAANVAAAGALMVPNLGTGVQTALGIAIGSSGSVLVTDYAADAGSTDAYVATLNPAPVALVTGAHYRFKANTANTGAATINFNGLGAKTIVKAAGGITTALADNDIRAGQWVDLVYDGTNMQMQSTLGNASSGGSGDVVGPASSANGSIAVFDGTTGKLLGDSGVNITNSYISGFSRLFGASYSFGLYENSGLNLAIPIVWGTGNFYTSVDVGINKISSGVIGVTDGAAGIGVITGIFRLKGYTVGTLPTGTQGDTCYVTDAVAPVSLATVAGGGSVVVKDVL